MRIVSAFTKQLSAQIKIISHEPGTEFVISIPLDFVPV